MFVVGMEFRVDIVKRQLKSSIAVSVAGMVIPLLFGAALAWIFVRYTDLFPKKASLVEAMLFLGASMCITAFPVLARIIHHKKLSGTVTGTVAPSFGLYAGAHDAYQEWSLSPRPVSAVPVFPATGTGKFAKTDADVPPGEWAAM